MYANGPADPTLTERAAAALLVLPADAVITGTTALWLHGIEIGNPLPLRAATRTSGQTRRRTIRLSRVERLPASHRRLATPPTAWLAACAALDLLEAVTAADWLIRQGHTTPQTLQDLATIASDRGCRLARRAAALTRTGSTRRRKPHCGSC